MATLALVSLFLLLPFLLSLALLCNFAGGSQVQRLLYHILRNPSLAHDIATTRLKLNGGTLHSTYVLLTCDPMNVHHIFSKRHSNFPKGPEFKEKLEGLGDGIFTADGEFGLSQRRILHSLFTSTRFNHLVMTTLLNKLESGLFPVVDRAVARSTKLDLQDVIKRLMFDNICTTVLGFDPCYLTVDLLPDLPYAKSYEEMEEVAFYRHLVPGFWWKFQRLVRIGEERKFWQAKENFDRFLYGRIKLKRDSLLRKAECGGEENRPFDLLTTFMTAAEEQHGGRGGGEENKAGEMGRFGKSDKFLRDTAFNLIAAGRDTVSVNLTWLLWLVASNPNVEAKILEEIKANLSENGEDGWRAFSEEELSKLVYLHGAMCEALRLYPPVPYASRTAVEDETLPSGHHVRKNATILFSVYAMGRMEEIWGEDWMEFKPERWINPEGKKIVHVPSYKFLTFSAGPRSCLGKRITAVYVKQVASAFLYNYKMELVEGHRVAPAASIVLLMEDGLKVRVSKRVM